MKKYVAPRLFVDTYAADDNIRVVNGRTRILLNGEPFERASEDSWGD